MSEELKPCPFCGEWVTFMKMDGCLVDRIIFLNGISFARNAE